MQPFVFSVVKFELNNRFQCFQACKLMTDGFKVDFSLIIDSAVHPCCAEHSASVQGVCHRGCGRSEGVDHVLMRLVKSLWSHKGLALPVVRSGWSGCQCRFSLFRLSVWIPEDPSDWLQRETSSFSPPTADYRDSCSLSFLPCIESGTWPRGWTAHRARIMAATHSEYRGYLRNTVDIEAGQHRFHPVQSSEPTYRPLIFGTLAVMGLLQVASSVAILLHLTGYLQEVCSVWHCVVRFAFFWSPVCSDTLCEVIHCRQQVYAVFGSVCKYLSTNTVNSSPPGCELR